MQPPPKCPEIFKEFLRETWSYHQLQSVSCWGCLQNSVRQRPLLPLNTPNWFIEPWKLRTDWLICCIGFIYIYIITYHCILVSLPFKKMMILFNSAPRLQECVFAHLSLYHHHFGFYVTRRQMFLKTPDSKVSLLYCWKKSHAREYVHVQIKDIVRLTSTK